MDGKYTQIPEKKKAVPGERTAYSTHLKTLLL